MKISIDGRQVEASAGATVLNAATAAGVYIPTLCWHPDLAGLPPVTSCALVRQGSVERRGPAGQSFMGCDLCVVEIEGKPDLVHACYIKAEPDMVVRTSSPRVREKQLSAFARVLATHPHSCLSCKQKAGCAREPCSLNVPPAERCCSKLGRCQIERLYDYLHFDRPLPSYKRDETLTHLSPLFAYDWNLCVGCLRCVRACAALRQVGALGFVMEDGRVRVGFVNGTPDDSACRFCGACAEVCSTGAIVDRQVRWADRERQLVPCREACPAGLDIPDYVRALAQGRIELAARIIRDKVPFGRVLGRICHAPCQTACRRGTINDAVSTCALKRYACDTAAPQPSRQPPATGKRVAVVGSGPAGLTAAWLLARKGHAVTVFEEQPDAGGMLRWGIPEFRLSRDVVRDEIEQIKRLGVEIKTSTRVKDVAALRKDFDAALLATGLPAGKRLGIPGSDGEGVWSGLELLRQVSAGKKPALGERVLVIGGGNAAVDNALTALRLGARAVTLVCLEAAHEMPAFAWELQHAREEGVQILNSWGPAAIRGTTTDFKRCVSVFDETGRFAPKFDEAKRMSLEADSVIAAIGQQAADDFKARADSAAAVFVAGDAARGPYSVINAVASARAAAADIDRLLGGTGDLVGDVTRIQSQPVLGREEGFAGRRAVAAGTNGFSSDQARQEASRCLQCDLRLLFRQPPLPPAEEALPEMSAESAARVPAAEGVLKLYGADRALLQIKGTANMRAELEKHVSNERVRYFTFEVDPYYTKRESEFLQAYLQQHGKMPAGVENDDDLY